jgi:hypothetical protein
MQPGAATIAASDAASRDEPLGNGRATAALSALGYAIVLALLAWPILQVANPALTDYPNHLARLYIADALANPHTLGRHYFLRSGLYPYLPFDLIAGALARVVGLELAGKLFVALALAMPTIGTIALARALHGKIGLWPIVSALFAYNLLLSWGLVTFLFAAGLALVVFAGWIATEKWPWLPRLALFSILSSLLFCSHPFGFSALGLLIGAWEFGRTPAWSWAELKQTAGRLCLAGLQFIPAVVIATQVKQTDLGSSVTRFGSLSARLTALLSPALFHIDRTEIIAFCAVIMAFIMALRRGVFTFDRRMTWPVAVMAAGSLVMPVFLSGVYLVHIRLPLVFVLLVIASCRPQPQLKRTVALAAAAFAAVFALRVATVADRLAEADREIAELRNAAAVIEEGARVLPVMTATRGASLPANHYWHALAYVAIDRAAFYPLLFSLFNVGVVPEREPSSAPATSPVPFEELDSPRGGIEKAQRPSGQKVYWLNWRQNFDYVVLLDFGQPIDAVPHGLAFVQRGDIFAIYRIVK